MSADVPYKLQRRSTRGRLREVDTEMIIDSDFRHFTVIFYGGLSAWDFAATTYPECY